MDREGNVLQSKWRDFDLGDIGIEFDIIIASERYVIQQTNQGSINSVQDCMTNVLGGI